jgi:glycosyltransferase involved in cell wall biosynthesis
MIDPQAASGRRGATGRRERVCVVRQHYVPQDTRVLREVGALAERGYEVDVLCVRKSGEPARERNGLVRIRRLRVPGQQWTGPAGSLVRYGWFFAAATVLLAVGQVRRRYAVVQVNSLPDVLVFAAVVPRLLGARVLLDLQECMPEFFATKFGTSSGHPAVRLIAGLEQSSIRFADAVITPTAQLRALFIGRGAEPGKVRVVMDGADERVFRRPSAPVPRAEGFVLISHGTMEERYGLDTMIHAVAELVADMPDLRLELYGDGSDRPRLERLARSLGVQGHVWFSDGYVPFPDLVKAIAAADAGVVAMKRDAFRDVTLPGKVFDFVVMGTPVISSRTRSMEETFGGDSVEYFTSEDASDLARAIRRLRADPDRAARLAEQAARAAEPCRWSRQRCAYLEAVDGRSVGAGSPGAAAGVR